MNLHKWLLSVKLFSPSRCVLLWFQWRWIHLAVILRNFWPCNNICLINLSLKQFQTGEAVKWASWKIYNSKKLVDAKRVFLANKENHTASHGWFDGFLTMNKKPLWYSLEMLFNWVESSLQPWWDVFSNYILGSVVVLSFTLLVTTRVATTTWPPTQTIHDHTTLVEPSIKSFSEGVAQKFLLPNYYILICLECQPHMKTSRYELI